MRLLTLLICSTALTALASSSAQALATYVYTGNNFDTIEDDDPPAGSYDTSMRITASITLPAPLAPNLVLESVTDQVLAATLSDGRQTFGDILAEFSTDATGKIVEWGVGTPFGVYPDRREAATTFRLDIPPGGLPSADFALIGLDPFAHDSARIEELPGTWTLVPEPATALLLAAGLLLLGARRLYLS